MKPSETKWDSYLSDCPSLSSDLLCCSTENTVRFLLRPGFLQHLIYMFTASCDKHTCPSRSKERQAIPWVWTSFRMDTVCVV